MPLKIWFNRHFQGTFAHVNALVDAGRGHEVYVSHVKDSVPSMQNHEELSRQSVNRFKEPANFSAKKYVEWCLDFCKANQIDVFIPGKEKERIARNRKRFKAAGTSLLVAGSEYTMRLLDKKDKFLEIAQRLVPTAPWAVFQTKEEFEAAWKALGEGKVFSLCVKPVQGIYGSGFWRLAASTEKKQLFSKTVLSVDEFKSRMDDGLPERWLLMQYCAGDERSVDCVAHQGEVKASVIRKKSAHGGQEVEHNPEITGYARALIKRFNLSGLINVQFKEHKGVPYVLEINPRASGGSGMAYLAGVPLMPLAVEALVNNGALEYVPVPLVGLKIQKTNLYFTVSDEGVPNDSN